MAKYSTATARKLAEQIHSRFGERIARACSGTPVPQSFVAGLISVEAGKDRNGQIKEDATRFEPGVFGKLIAVRDGRRPSWSGIKRNHIADATDTALRALATSYSLTQIMGWHCINNLDCTIAELRDPEKHLGYAVKLLTLNAADGDFQRKAYVGEFKEWNSGSEVGRTYDPDYVHNATVVMEEYAALGDVETEPFSASLVTDSVTEETPASPEPEVKPPSPIVNVEHAEEVKATASTPVPGGAKDDPPKQASQGGTKSTIATIAGGITGIGAAVGGWLHNNASLAMVGIVCVTIVILVWMFRQFIMDYLRMKYISDPNRINVK